MSATTNPKKQSLMPASKLRKALRVAGHHLSPVVQIGKEGPTPAVASALDEQLLAHELIKVKVGTESPEGRFEVAAWLAALPGAQVAQVLGRTALVYRRHPYRPRFEPEFATPEPARPEPKDPKRTRRSRGPYGRAGRPPMGRPPKAPREPRPPRGPSGPKAPRERKAEWEPRGPRTPRERSPEREPRRTTREPREPREPRGTGGPKGRPERRTIRRPPREPRGPARGPKAPRGR